MGPWMQGPQQQMDMRGAAHPAESSPQAASEVEKPDPTQLPPWLQTHPPEPIEETDLSHPQLGTDLSGMMAGPMPGMLPPWMQMPQEQVAQTQAD